MKTLSLSLASLFALGLFGCQSEEQPPAAPASESPSSVETKTEEQKPETPRELVGGPMKDGEDVAVMETTAGRIVIRFFPDKAPETVKNFIKLANSKFYDGVKFHRTIQGFMIQGGDPNTKDKPQSSWGTGGPGYTIKDEFSDVSHTRGILSMANTGQPNSSGCQFFIMVADNPGLDHKYSVFGEVVEGMNVADNIVATPVTDGNGTVVAEMAKTIKSVKIEKWPLKP